VSPRYSSGGGGSGDDGLRATASAFVSGASIRIRLLVSTLVGGWVIAWWSGFNSTLDNALTWGRRLILGIPESSVVVYDTLLSIPEGMFGTSWTAAGNFVGLDVLGPFAWPLAMGVVFVSLLLLSWAIDNAGVI